MVLFKRRQPRLWYQHLKEALWPTSGWQRAAQYIAHRVDRLQDTPYSIAAGLACGVAVSFTPLVGFHLLIALGLSWVIGGNMAAAAVGTIAGNPWTLPFIWALMYQTGALILGIDDPVEISGILQLDNLFQGFRDVLVPVFWPMLVGCVPFVIASWVLVYFPVKKVVKVRQHRKAERRRLRRLERQKTQQRKKRP